MKSYDYFPLKELPAPEVSKRATCYGCHKIRVVSYDRPGKTHEDIALKRTPKAIGWRYQGYGHFCSLTCATRWANNYFDNRAK